MVTSTAGDFECRVLVACAGLSSDRIARMAGLPIDVAIVPFRGEYWTLAPQRGHLVRHLIYPVPDPAFPFLGVHFTRRVDGVIEAGPNAVLALAREQYGRAGFDLRDAWDTAPMAAGFWRMSRRPLASGHRRTATGFESVGIREGVRRAGARVETGGPHAGAVSASGHKR